jgi:outer membrane protein OmpA-like peptidoglycan-associated protein
MKQLTLSVLLCLITIGFARGQEQFTVYFDFNVDLAADASGIKLSQWIASHKNIQVSKVHGFADVTGNAAYNVDLSYRRAAYVVQQLKKSTIDVTEIEIKGFGAALATGNRVKDRKVVVYFSVKQPHHTEQPKTEESEFTKVVTTAGKGDRIRIPNLNFYNNSDIMLPESRPVMLELFTILKNRPALKIDIQGHICCQKNEEDAISLRRAVAIYTLLVKSGIDKNRLTYKSFGSSKPIYPLPEKNEDEKMANRRVEIEIVDK